MHMTQHDSGMSRRGAMGLAAMAALAAPMLHAPAFGAGDDEGLLRFGEVQPFSWDMLRQQALILADRPYVPPRRVAAADAVDYDALNRVHYRPEAELWPGDREGAVRFFLLRRYAPTPIAVHVVENGQAREILYSNRLFSMPEDSPARRIEGDKGGFAGFRVMNPSGVGDWLAYMGASYFRSAGPLDQYGLSARGLALDTAVDGREEFPMFSRFWLERDENSTIVHALLESPGVTGAWRFATRHEGRRIVQDVDCVFKLRADVERLGIAPLTSMFWYGEGDVGPRVDWRPEIHDSDGLLVLNGKGEPVWRPLVNPAHVQVQAFADHAPKGFGLLQRDRDYDNYEDDGVFYHKRPHLWVEPRGDWGAGAVELVELPTKSETEDNIVAFWRPAGPARAGKQYELAYRLSWLAEEPVQSDLARVIATRRGPGGRPGLPPKHGVTKLVVDFEGPALRGKGRKDGVKADLALDNGRVVSTATYPVVERDGRWRLMLDVIPDAGKTMDLRATLTHGGARLSETWIYPLYG